MPTSTNTTTNTTTINSHAKALTANLRSDLILPLGRVVDAWGLVGLLTSDAHTPRRTTNHNLSVTAVIAWAMSRYRR